MTKLLFLLVVVLAACSVRAQDSGNFEVACVDASDLFFDEDQSLFSSSISIESYLGKWISFGKYFNQSWETISNGDELIFFGKKNSFVKHLHKKSETIVVHFPEINSPHVHYLNTLEMGHCKLFNIKSKQTHLTQSLICAVSPPMKRTEGTEKFICYKRPSQPA